MPQLALATRAVHVGEHAAQADYTPISTPVHNAVTFVYPDMETLDAVFAGGRPGYIYSRFDNPTVVALETALASLEETDAAVACSSGMAALHLALLAAGATSGHSVLAARDLYGGTYSLLTRILAPQGVAVHFVDLCDLEAAAQAMASASPSVVLAETLSNPLLCVPDLPALTALAHSRGARVVVDSTFATPCIYRPATCGADYVVHSATKYLGGHGDVTGGIIATSQANAQALRELRKLIGSVLGPNEAWLILRGLKTLVLRMREQCRNALLVARHLQSDPRVSRVHYPALPTHPTFATARRLFPANLAGAIVSFEIRQDTQAAVFSFMDALRLVMPATSLGDVTSLVLYPAHSSHRALSDQEKQLAGITAGLVRLSVGVEEVADIISDLDQALMACEGR